MKLGVDLSMLDELLPLGARYFYQGKPIEPFSFFAEHSGISMVRLRLWHHPYDENGNATPAIDVFTQGFVESIKD